MKRCGKTTLLDVLGSLVLRPLPTANVTSSAVFRVVEAYRPTLLVDEADTFLRDNDELRGIINSGHRHGGTVLRTVGDDYEPRAFSTYSACAIALIGHLPDTLHDRAVVIELKRRLATEPVSMFRPDRADHLAVLTRQAARWARDYAEQVGGAEPAMPDGVFNREADNWRPLLAIAQVAGGDWPSRATAAVLGCHIADEEERLAMLLADIRTTFGAKPDQERLSSSDLVEALREIEGRPWAEYGKNRKPISQNQLARLLKPLAICPEVFRDEAKTPRGYQLFQFSDAFDRYLPSAGASQPQHLNECDEQRTSDNSQPQHSELDVAVEKDEKSNNGELYCGVAVEKGDLSERRVIQLVEEVAGELYRRHDWPSQPSPQEVESEIRRLLEAEVAPEAIDHETKRVMSAFAGEEAPKKTERGRGRKRASR